MVELLNYVEKKRRCTIAGITVQRAQFLSGVGGGGVFNGERAIMKKANKETLALKLLRRRLTSL